MGSLYPGAPYPALYFYPFPVPPVVGGGGPLGMTLGVVDLTAPAGSGAVLGGPAGGMH